MVLPGDHQRSLVLPGAQWCSPVLSGAPWCSLVLPGAHWRSLVLPGVPWCSLAFPGVPWCSLALPGAPWCSVVFPGAPSGAHWDGEEPLRGRGHLLPGMRCAGGQAGSRNSMAWPLQLLPGGHLPGQGSASLLPLSHAVTLFQTVQGGMAHP